MPDVGILRKLRLCLLRSIAGNAETNTTGVISHSKWVKEKRAVRQKTRNSLKKGIIQKKPCEICGKEDVEIHHLDYVKPLEIKWLCNEHHLEEHQRLRDNDEFINHQIIGHGNKQ